MTTQADITLAAFNVNQTATTLQTNISTLINAIADQNTITSTHRLPTSLLPQLNSCATQIAALITIIGAIAGASAVG